ncbi:hypothetical protein M404DRAFT_991190 [Pisolithus tinctorius Marx 270]|uniref:Uncharacterized protein n=1 Tax=Pisolithus tinctorius Marx 270 TaxID=870435 RepID=A0A0C3JZ63_PISTI|nr:hypothetical protein M404DRAFT_991190 [Pisolithus tinctorius Marx 270]
MPCVVFEAPTKRKRATYHRHPYPLQDHTVDLPFITLLTFARTAFRVPWPNSILKKQRNTVPIVQLRLEQKVSSTSTFVPVFDSFLLDVLDFFIPLWTS